MSEVEKMYENAGIEPEIYEEPSREVDNDGEISAWYINEIYPPFTPEKQLSLIKWLCKNTYRNYLMIRYNFTNYYWQIECNMVDSNKTDKFSKCIASIVNNLWQDLTEQEQEQIRSILNG